MRSLRPEKARNFGRSRHLGKREFDAVLAAEDSKLLCGQRHCGRCRPHLILLDEIDGKEASLSLDRIAARDDPDIAVRGYEALPLGRSFHLLRPRFVAA